MTGPRAGVEVLDQRPTAPSRRAWLVVGLLLLGLVGVGLEDRRAHAAEAARIDACLETAQAARDLADRRVSAMATYVRPALSGAYTYQVREGLAALVARSARRAAPALDDARGACARIDVRPWHGDLQDRLDGCLATLDARLAWFSRVAGDGAVAFRSAAGAAHGCAR